MKEPIVWLIFGSVAIAIILNQFGLDADYRREVLLQYGHIAIPVAALLVLCLAIYLFRANRAHRK